MQVQKVVPVKEVRYGCNLSGEVHQKKMSYMLLRFLRCWPVRIGRPKVNEESYYKGVPTKQ